MKLSMRDEDPLTGAMPWNGAGRSVSRVRGRRRNQFASGEAAKFADFREMVDKPLGQKSSPVVSQFPLCFPHGSPSFAPGFPSSLVQLGFGGTGIVWRLVVARTVKGKVIGLGQGRAKI